MPIVSTKSDLHPYQCGQNCVHCTNPITGDHGLNECAFCWDDFLGECLVLHNGNRYDICAPDDLSLGIALVEYLDDSWPPIKGQWQVAYKYRLSGAHAGPPIEILMVDPHEEPDEDGRNVCWERLLWADDQTTFDNDYLDDIYHDALIEDLQIIAKECWD